MMIIHCRNVILSLSKRKYIQLNLSLPVWYNYVCVWHIPFNIMFKKIIYCLWFYEINYIVRFILIIINLIMVISYYNYRIINSITVSRILTNVVYFITINTFIFVVFYNYVLVISINFFFKEHFFPV